MAIKDTLRRFLGFRLSGGAFTEMAIPAGWNYKGYLEAYGQIGWLFGAVSLIAHSVASSAWMLYQNKGKGEYEEIDEHPILELWDRVNPFQTRYQFLLQYQMYIGLVGEAFIYLNMNGLGVPAEMWLIPPMYMKIIPSPEKYISHYQYEQGSTKVDLQIPEIVHVFDPNPANPYRGLGAAKSISTDLDSEIHAAKYQNKLFYNDATPRLFLEFPEIPPKIERQALRDEFLDVHQGWRNSYRPAFLWGGAKANTIAMNSRDMDFANLRKVSKEIILAAYHIPESLIGASEVGSRARAEADEYIFSKYTIKPALQRLREALNEQLCPLFDDGLELGFDDPVPQDAEMIRKNNREDFKAGIITREEARMSIGLDAKGEGVYVMPFNVVETPAKYLLAGKKKALTSEGKEAFWKDYAAKTESEENLFKKALKELWGDQEDEVLRNLNNADTPDEALFDKKKNEDMFKEKLHPVLRRVFEKHYQDGIDLVNPDNPHQDSKQADPLAIEWLEEHALELAQRVVGTDFEALRETLIEGFEAGESIPTLKKRVAVHYDEANKFRAILVARTETIAAAVEGNLQGYAKSGVEMVQWYTAVDNRRCSICEPYHDEEFTLRESHGLIPAHPQCRCVFIPVV